MNLADPNLPFNLTNFRALQGELAHAIATVLPVHDVRRVRLGTEADESGRQFELFPQSVDEVTELLATLQEQIEDANALVVQMRDAIGGVVDSLVATERARGGAFEDACAARVAADAYLGKTK